MKRFILIFGTLLLCIQSINAADKDDLLLQDYDLIAVNGNVATVVDFMEFMSSDGKRSKMEALNVIKQGLSNKMAHRIYNSKDLGEPSPATVYIAKYMGETVYKREAKKSKYKGKEFAFEFWISYISNEALIKLDKEFEAEMKKEFPSDPRLSKKELQENAQLAWSVRNVAISLRTDDRELKGVKLYNQAYNLFIKLLENGLKNRNTR